MKKTIKRIFFLVLLGIMFSGCASTLAPNKNGGEGGQTVATEQKGFNLWDAFCNFWLKEMRMEVLAPNYPIPDYPPGYEKNQEEEYQEEEYEDEEYYEEE